MAKVRDCLGRARAQGKMLEAELILAEILNVRREQVFASPKRTLTPSEHRNFDDWWRRVEAGEPVAYILGRKEFFGLEFRVDSRVLIPRPETEHLVEAVIELTRGMECPRILDVGTGCGAIALALARTLPTAQVYGSDVSEKAIQVARENAERLGLERVEFFVSDLLVQLPTRALEVDVLVANLPYIGLEKFHFVEKNVEDFEPHIALFGGSDGLELYRQLFEQINYLSEEGRSVPRWVLGEFGSLQRERLEEVIRAFFSDANVAFHQDLAGLDRYFILDLDYAG